jgi:hypothetical protein
MVARGQSVDRRRFGRTRPMALWTMALCVLAVMPLARADDALERPIKTAAPLEIPHSLNLVLAEMARKRNRKPDNIESHSFLDLTPGLNPVTWPKNSDVRARLVTPEIKSTPVVGWIAENLYRSKNENGWCLEVDPGGGEYLVFYRFHPKR